MQKYMLQSFSFYFLIRTKENFQFHRNFQNKNLAWLNKSEENDYIYLELIYFLIKSKYYKSRDVLNVFLFKTLNDTTLCTLLIKFRK